MKPYADTSFFTKFYLPLPDSDLANNLIAEAGGRINFALPITWLHRVEIVNALEIQVFSSRLHSQPRITPEHAAIAQASFRQDLGRSDFLQLTPINQEALVTKSEDISLRHTARSGFKTYDLVHVASALLLGCDTFWSFDTKASRLAKLEGLRTI